MAKCTRRLREALVRMHDPRQLVLTIRSTGEPLKKMIADLLKWFRLLRRTPEWTEKVKGGVYVVEVSLNSTTGLWHPHLHVLYGGMYWPQRRISELWASVTGNSAVVYINAASDRHCKYLATYVGDPGKLKLNTPEQVCEYESATHALRMIQAFGDLHGVPLDDKDSVNPPAREAIPLYRLVSASRGGHLGARRMLEVLSVRYPYLRTAVFWRPADWASTNRPPPETIDAEIIRCVKLVAELRHDYNPSLGFKRKGKPCSERCECTE
jgi:hypothetical protein